eukprot:5031136-Amphidinium_carterae.1
MTVPHTANMDRSPGLHQAPIPASPAGHPTLGFMAPRSGSGNTAHTANDSLTTTNLCATPQSFYSGIVLFATCANKVLPTLPSDD